MRLSGLALLGFLVAAAGFGQSQHSGAGAGYTGIGPTGFGTAAGRGAGPSAVRSGTGFRGNGYGPSGRTGYRRQSVVAPIYVGIPIYGGYAYGWGGDDTNAPPADAGDQSAAGNPSVVINQDYVPDHASPMIRDYSNTGDSGQSSLQTWAAPGPPPGEPAAPEAPISVPDDDQATIYLIAFRDHTIVPALAYWTEGKTLKYVNVDHDINQITLDLVDRDLSNRLNQERNVDFRLPGR